MIDPTNAPPWPEAPTETFFAVFDATTEAIECFAGSDHDTIHLDDEDEIAHTDGTPQYVTMSMQQAPPHGSLFGPIDRVLQTWRDERLLPPEL